MIQLGYVSVRIDAPMCQLTIRTQRFASLKSGGV
jgi:hypothetical protein